MNVSGKGCNNPGASVVAVFLGPDAWIGSSGGGDEFEIPVSATDEFSTTYRIPATYTSGGDVNEPVTVTTGADYAIAVYPMAICSVPLTVVSS